MNGRRGGVTKNAIPVTLCGGSGVCVKKQLLRLIMQEETESRTNHRLTVNHLCDCNYAILLNTAHETQKLTLLQRYKAKLVRFYAAMRNKILLDPHEHDNLEGEEQSLFHILKVLRRREVRDIW
jgi:hypothetical protein